MPILNEWTLDFISNSVAQTERLGARLGQLLQVGDLICLSGELGAGKTAMARGIGRGWGTTLRVTSPTFTLVNEHPRPRDGRILYHIDCYRLESVADIVTAGLEEILEPGSTCMIEWPERVSTYLMKDRFWVELVYMSQTKRRLRFTASGTRSAQLLNDFKRSAFGV